MALAYHLLTHGHPAQVARLLRAIWHPGDLYVLHYDRRRPRREHEAIRRLAAGRDNVLIQPPRAVLWGRYSLYAAQEQGLRIALAARGDWTHWINLSGQCYPLQAPDAIHTTLRAAHEASFIRHFAPLERGDWSNPAWRVQSRVIDSPMLEWWLRLPGLGRRLRGLLGGADALPRVPWIRRPLPECFVWYGGDNWAVLHRAAAEYLCHAPEARAIVRALQHSGFPEESIYQSALLNSPLRATVRNDHLRAIHWQPGIGSPGIFSRVDRDRLEEAEAAGRLFARKFAPRDDRTAAAESEAPGWRELLV